MNPVHFSSATDNWATPQDLFERLNAQHGPFYLDVCASVENTKCYAFVSKELNDSLALDWNRLAADLELPVANLWMNPPYGRQIGHWVKKAYETAKRGAKVVCLLPARTDTKWFQDYCLPHGKIEFLRGRLKFGGAKNCAPFPSMVVVFGGE